MVVSRPALLYGTAWKEEATQSLVELAIAEGFRGIDTANQRRHYDEAAVGAGIAAAIARGAVHRDELFIQTKFTFLRGQDHRLPYDAKAPVEEQVAQSVASSLEHLQVERLDSVLLHGPTQRVGLTDQDWAAWRALQAAGASGRTRSIGVSNIGIDQLMELCSRAGVRPAFVQNRCYAAQGWDRAVRRFCKAEGIVYQGFSLLTANPQVVSGPLVRSIAKRYGRTPAQVVFRFALDVGMLPLTGTRSGQHMREDLAATDFQLEASEVEQIEAGGT